MPFKMYTADQRDAYVRGRIQARKLMPKPSKKSNLAAIFVACTRLYKPLGWLVRQSIGPSVGWSLFTKHALYGDRPCFFL